MNEKDLLTDMEIDIIGEIMNISLGSSATSVSGMLDKRVNITTPRVEVKKASDFQFERYEPAMGVEINYIQGLSGTNVMILKLSDVKVIVGLLLGMDYGDDENFVMDEMSTSAICEVMNQMMGAASTALADFLNRPIDISTPTSFPIDDSVSFKEKYYSGDNMIVSIYFRLMIEDLIDSEFISVLPMELAKELVSILAAASASEPEPAPTPAPVQAAPPPPAPAPAPVQQAPQPVQLQQRAPVQQRPQQPKEVYEVQQAPVVAFDEVQPILSEEQTTNLNLIMSVPLQITVEIGRTKRQIKDILEFTSGTIVDLNKQAGSQVDIFVNGQPIAKGDVVVVDDFYGVRITEILSNKEIIKIL